MRTIEIADLTAWIKDRERQLAPGTETSLWGEYCAEILAKTGVPAYDEAAGDELIPVDEAAWWVGAYCALEAAAAGGCAVEPLDPDKVALLPREPQVADYRALDELIPGAEREGLTAAVTPMIEEGYAWTMAAIRSEAQ